MVRQYYLTRKSVFFFLFILLIILFKKNIFSQVFKIPDNYIESPLIYPHETILKGISKITPVEALFSNYTSLELSSVKKNIRNPSNWLEDKIFDELGNITETERLLRSEDSPLSDPIFNQFKHLPFHIDDTLEQLAVNPIVFCIKTSIKFNKSGKFFELNCTIPFGFFNNYLIMRLQFDKKIWYFTKISTLNYNRMLELTTIAESFQIY